MQNSVSFVFLFICVFRSAIVSTSLARLLRLSRPDILCDLRLREARLHLILTLTDIL